jgi:DNA polymerase-1
MRIDDFDEVWLFDFEFQAPPGERPRPICLVAREWRTGRRLSVWEDALSDDPPYRLDRDVVFVAYFASAEFGCHRALGWPMPEHVIDLYAEFKNLTNGLELPYGAALLGAMAYFNLPTIGAEQKTEMRDLAIRGGPWHQDEKQGLLNYCESDVICLDKLFTAMVPKLDIPLALLRGRYMKAVAEMEHVGVPLDMGTFEAIREHWGDIKRGLIERVDRDYGVFEGETFKLDRFTAWLVRSGVPWPRLHSGRLALDDDTFRVMATAYPRVAPLRELRHSLSQLKLNKLTVGSDGRNRCLLSPFSSKTGRNQPSNSKFIFGPSVWIRGLIRPDECSAIAYIDWGQQEIGIAAALSGDQKMIEAYVSGDPYLEFGKQSGVIPDFATKETHGGHRNLFKECMLGVQYGIGANSLAQRIGEGELEAQNLLDMHHRSFRDFWRWSDGVVDFAMIRNYIHTVFGWTQRLGPTQNPRSLRNFPMQANGAEMLRLACCYATESGIRVCAPVHDALLIEAPVQDIDEAVAETQLAMARASADVLGQFKLRSEARIVRYPDRYADDRGKAMWQAVTEILTEVEDVRSVA